MKDLTIAPWADSLVERLGHEPRSQYVETYWCPVLGPSCLLAYRRLGVWVTLSDQGVIDVDELAACLGVGGRRNPSEAMLARLVTFHAARWNGDVLEVRRKLPTLSHRQLSQLHPVLQARHERDVTLRSSDHLAVTA